MEHRSSIRPALSALFTLSGLIQFQVIRLELPALHSAPLADALSVALPPVLLVAAALLRRRLPPICFLPVAVYPSLSASILPLSQLACLSVLTSLVVYASFLDFIAAAAASAAFFAAHILAPRRFPPLCASNLFRSLLPSLTFALACTHFAARSTMLTTLRFFRARRLRRKDTISLPFRLLVVFVAAFLFARLPPLVPPPAMPAAFRLLEQARGPTGLVSVVENIGRHRVLLADISVLGGYFDSSRYYPDSIFSQFYVHEAVRLTDDGRTPSAALCIGIGIGVVPNGLSQHGVNVTAVDIDPVVARYAQKYFSLRVPVVVEDAVSFVEKAPDDSYHYVIHDVFTGGTMPSALFSHQMFGNISRVLKSDGVLAVNFVGAIERPKTPATQAVSLVFQRLRSVFKNVRAFSDGLDSRMHNIVFFASHDAQRLQFRQPVEADFLGSPLRRQALSSFLQHEVEDDILEGSESSHSDWTLYRGLFDIAEEHRSLMYKIHPKDLWPAVLAAERAR